MTKYMTLDKPQGAKAKKTVFKHILMDSLRADSSDKDPQDYDNVLFLGHDNNYGDVFKAWDDEFKEDFCLYFGVKGTEFDD